KADEFGEVVLKRAMVLVPPTAAQASSRRDAAALARAHTCVPAPLCGTAPAPTLQALPGVAGGASTPSENAARRRCPARRRCSIVRSPREGLDRQGCKITFSPACWLGKCLTIARAGHLGRYLSIGEIRPRTAARSAGRAPAR